MIKLRLVMTAQKATSTMLRMLIPVKRPIVPPTEISYDAYDMVAKLCKNYSPKLASKSTIETL